MSSETTTGTAGRAGDRPAAPAADRIVVGVDGSPGARSALVWALAAAARSGSPVEVVSAFPVDFYWPDAYVLDARHIETIRSDTEGRARACVAEAMSDPAVTAVPRDAAIDVRFLVAAGAPAEHLVQRAEGARLLVVGSRGRGNVRSTLLGSVALHCATHAPCPVVVVHPTFQPAAAWVVVGIDESAEARAALARAVEEAERMGAQVEAVVVSQPLTYWSDVTVAAPPPLGETLKEVRRRAERLVTEVVGPESRHTVRVLTEVGEPGDVLVRKAERAALLVVGSRSRSRLVGLLLGSVALHCVVHAPCPVMVVRPEGTRTTATEPAAAVNAHG